MNQEEFRVIPGYAGYDVSQSGTIKSIERDLILRQYLFNGYLIVDTFRGSLTETLPVHRAVALAWVDNVNSSIYTVVNHCDGNPLNNWYRNLEWTDYSGNNYHAVNTGLRSDNIRCRVRDFQSGNVLEFSSMAQAAEHMGLTKDAPITQLRLKKFGSLINDRFEFRFENESTPWFYETRTERLEPPSRYQVKVRESNGDVREIYSSRDLLKDYQLYGSPEGRSMPALAQFGNQFHPDKEFSIRDSYMEKQFRETRRTERSVKQVVEAARDDSTISFDSLTQCARHFNVDRSSITNRLNNGKTLDGWTFIQTQLPL